MGRTWIRLDVSWRRHPRIRRLGPFGASVACQIWCLGKELGRSGFIPSVYLTADFIAAEMGHGPDMEPTIQQAVDAMWEADLLEREDGGARIRDWSDYQIDSSKERTRKWRDRRDSDPPVLDAGVTVTDRHTRHVTSRDVTCPVPSRPVPSQKDLLSHRKDPDPADPPPAPPQSTAKKSVGWSDRPEWWLLAGQVHRLVRERGIAPKTKRYRGTRDYQRIRRVIRDGATQAEINLVLRWSSLASKEDASNWYQEVVTSDPTAALAPTRWERNLQAAQNWESGHRPRLAPSPTPQRSVWQDDYDALFEGKTLLDETGGLYDDPEAG